MEVYPNPFLETSNIVYTIPEKCFISLKVYDLSGKELYTIQEGIKLRGTYITAFDGSGLCSGVYYLRIVAGGIAQTRKVVLIRE